ncbi:hypothetical protein ACFL0A_00815, partial [Patescibacteria group bacterium]
KKTTMSSDYKKYKEILRKYHYSSCSKEEFLKMIRNIEEFAELFSNFEKISKKNRKNLINL